SGYLEKRIKEFAKNFSETKKTMIPKRILAFELKPRDLLCRLHVEAADGGAAILLAEATLNTTMAVLNFFASVFFGRTDFPIVRQAGQGRSRWSTKFAFTKAPKLDLRKHGGRDRHWSAGFDTKLLSRY